jgi:hypothetical protein
LPCNSANTAAGADRRELSVIADQHELALSSRRDLHQRRQALGVGHPSLVHHDDRLRVEVHAARLNAREQRIGRDRALEARVGSEALGGGSRHSGANHLMALAPPSAGRGSDDDALAGAGLADEQADSARAGDRLDRLALLGAQLPADLALNVKPRQAQRGLAHRCRRLARA